MITIDFPMPVDCPDCPLERFSAASGRMICPLIPSPTTRGRRPAACPLKEAPDETKANI